MGKQVYRKKILVVEDNAFNREMLSAILSDTYEIYEAENGLIALDILREHRDVISLVLLDVMMPVMDGYTFLNHVRSDNELSLIPIIVVTQSSSAADELSALAHGATDFVSKPYHPQIIMKRISALISLRENAATINQLQYDRLTGLYSREYFNKKVQDRLREDPDTEYCIACSNVENFKLVNNIYGTQAGDTLMKEIADLTKAMVGSSGFCGRFSADRVICLQTRDRALRGLARFGTEKNVPGSRLLKSVSLRWGVYEITDRTVPVELMCDRAMIAVDSINGHYDQYYALYDEKLMSKMLREQEITACMEQALEDNQFLVYYQPKYHLQDNTMSGAEALVRWAHPQWGFMSPGEFIPLFEKNGFIPKLDHYIWDRVCAQLHAWQEMGLRLLPVSVNVSRADVFQPGLVEYLVSLVQKHGLDPTYLHLEITESSYADNPTQIIRTVAELRRRGFIVEMDDFGSGYSSLNMLSQMPLDVLKLDMKFIQNEIAKPTDHSLLHDVINMAHRVKMSVVAEGVETREQVNRLRLEGCDYSQGYYFSRPIPTEEYEALLRDYRPNGVLVNHQRDSLRRSLIVLDEDPAYRETVRKVFADEFDVLEIESVQNALQYMESPEMDDATAVVLSAGLPENGAATVLHALRSSPSFWNIPVLLMLSDSTCTNNLSFLQDADDFLCKRHPLFDLEKRMHQIINAATFLRRDQSVQDAASHDPLTGLLNRRGLTSAMNALCSSDLPLAVCYFGLDFLKELNAAHGNITGDQTLRIFSDLLRTKSRFSDILCRYTGSSFVLILKNTADPESAEKIVNTICKSFRACSSIGADFTTCTVGVAMCGEGEPISARLIDQAISVARKRCAGSCALCNV